MWYDKQKLSSILNMKCHKTKLQIKRYIKYTKPSDFVFTCPDQMR